MTVSLMTQLDAVNKCLEGIWETPVSTLESSGIESVASAKRVLNSVLRSVQSRGWAFNTDDDLVLTPDINGFIQLPDNTLEVKTQGVDAYKNYVQRGQRLYDRVNHVFTFTQAVHVRLISLLDFEDLPSCAREYIGLMAARAFVDKWLQKSTPTAISMEEAEALRDLEESEGQTHSSNMFNDSWSVSSTLERM